ncbi:MAG: hypothetical protein KKD44_12810 [Proteobacteria bacterium]|nr:hypothetical protein [Pseudomonadota bacterium]
MKKIAISVVVFLCLSGNAFSETLQFGIVASGDVVVANVEVQSRQTYGILAGGGGISFANGDYTIGEAMVALRSDRLLPGLRYGLGFKGYYGSVDEEGGNYDGIFAALGFMVDVDYELTSAFNPVEVPIEAYVGLCYAPSPLVLEDTEQYQEYKGGLRFYLLESAFISVECKYRKFNFKDTDHGEWDRDDTIVTAGLTLRL